MSDSDESTEETAPVQIIKLAPPLTHQYVKHRIIHRTANCVITDVQEDYFAKKMHK